MNAHRHCLALLAAGVALVTVAPLPLAANVLPPQRRQPTIDQAETLLAHDQRTPLPPDLLNPFWPQRAAPQPTATAPASAPATLAPVGDYALLETIAPEITPTGTMILGGAPLLLFGQKKVRVGDSLPVLYQGQRYTLVIAAIEPTSFTLRLGNAEFTRPINPPK